VHIVHTIMPSGAKQCMYNAHRVKSSAYNGCRFQQCVLSLLRLQICADSLRGSLSVGPDTCF